MSNNTIEWVEDIDLGGRATRDPNKTPVKQGYQGTLSRRQHRFYATEWRDPSDESLFERESQQLSIGSDRDAASGSDSEKEMIDFVVRRENMLQQPSMVSSSGTPMGSSWRSSGEKQMIAFDEVMDCLAFPEKYISLPDAKARDKLTEKATTLREKMSCPESLSSKEHFGEIMRHLNCGTELCKEDITKVMSALEFSDLESCYGPRFSDELFIEQNNSMLDSDSLPPASVNDGCSWRQADLRPTSSALSQTSNGTRGTQQLRRRAHPPPDEILPQAYEVILGKKREKERGKQRRKGFLSFLRKNRQKR